MKTTSAPAGDPTGEQPVQQQTRQQAADGMRVLAFARKQVATGQAELTDADL